MQFLYGPLRLLKHSLLVSGIVAASSVTTASATTLVDFGSTTLDTVTNLQWLDLVATQGLSYSQVSSNNGVSFIANGWRYASSSELRGLFDAAGGGGTYSEQTVTDSAASNPTYAAVQLLAQTIGTGMWESNPSSIVFDGLLGENTFGDPGLHDFGRIASLNFAPPDSSPFFFALLHDAQGGYGPDYAYPQMGSFLVRANVAVTPIPPSLLLMVTAIGGLGFAHWRRRTA
jgi:hypothetical protein